MLSIIRKITWVLLSIALMLAAVVLLWDDIYLNHYSLQSVKSNGFVPIPKFLSTNFICQAIWMKGSQTNNLQAQIDLMSCSPIYMDIMRAMNPANVDLAMRARELYPEQVTPLYWLAEANGLLRELKDKPIYEEIVKLAPNEGLAWCQLGYIYENEGNIDASLRARKNCCLNGDLGSHGCYFAGKIYESRGMYNEAVKYYSLSGWEVSKKASDDLKTELDPGELVSPNKKVP